MAEGDSWERSSLKEEDLILLNHSRINTRFFTQSRGGVEQEQEQYRSVCGELEKSLGLRPLILFLIYFFTL
jgi:hypothetical protein